jgi:hypothetical protein
MYYLHCLFDHRRNPPRPLYAASINAQTKDVKFYQLYLPGTKFPLDKVHENKKQIRELLNKKDVVLCDFHSYIKAFDLDINRRFEVWDTSLEQEIIPDSIAAAKKMLLLGLSKMMKSKQEEWQQILSNSQLVYSYLEDRGYYHEGVKKYPKYRLAYSGRSRCLDSNIQGTNEKDVIHHVDEEFDVFVHFDWTAADFRVASLISKDQILKQSFKQSDPYTMLFEALDSEEITRDQCKLELFRSLYSMNYSADILEFYPDFAKWMKDSSQEIEKAKHSYSILNRCFEMDEDRTIRSVFNAQIQGSVAHAMQNVLYRVFKIYPENLLAEIHDSLILCCNKKDLKTVIDEVANIMLFPFDGILEENPKFPLKVSIGYEWKKWRPYKEYR